MRKKLSHSMESAMTVADISTRPVTPKKYRQKMRHYILGTVENRRKSNRLKKPKEERSDSFCRPFAGYVHDQENFSSRKWSEEALLKKAGYTESVWLENFPD